MRDGAGSPGDEGRVLGAVRAMVAARSAAGAAEVSAKAGKWWVAFSGGVDSAVLLDAAARVLGEAAPEQLAAVHVNHGLHPDADAWEEHCRKAAARRGVPFAVRRVTVREAGGPGGIEAAARQARYAAFRDVVRRGDPILIAHHRDDQAETVLLRVLRGAGPAGAAAMRAETVLDGLRVARPLLAISRAEILDYARGRGLSWIEDPANLDPAHDRNHVRNQVLPIVGERWPGVRATFARFAKQAGEVAAMLDDLAALDLAAGRGRTPQTLRASAIAALPSPRAANALRVWLVARHGIAPPPRRWLRVLVEEMARAAPDRIPEAVHGGIWVRRYRGDLHTGRTGSPPLLPASAPWRLDTPLDLSHGRLAATLTRGESEGWGGRLAAARIPPIVEVRFRCGGERCRPARRGVTKPLKHLLQELGVPPWERGSLPLVFVGGHLAAAPGLFVCDPFAAREGEPAWRIEWASRRSGDRAPAEPGC